MKRPTMKKILLLLATEKGYEVLHHIADSDFKGNIGGVISFRDKGVIRDWCDDIESLCVSGSIPFYHWNNIKESLTELISENSITGLIAIGWRYMLPLTLNRFLEDDMIIIHDSLLPKYRGFAPIVTAMMCGEERVGATAIFAAEKVDSGDIIIQKSFEIDRSVYIDEVIHKMSGVYTQIVDGILQMMNDGTLKGIPQDDTEATYSIWRDEQDYLIDWNKNAEQIYTQIRSLGNPYKGAHTYADGEEIRIIKASVEETDIDLAIRDAGKIWSISSGRPVVVCGKGLLMIEEALDTGGKNYQFKRVRMRLGK